MKIVNGRVRWIFQLIMFFLSCRYNELCSKFWPKLFIKNVIVKITFD